MRDEAGCNADSILFLLLFAIPIVWTGWIVEIKRVDEGVVLHCHAFQHVHIFWLLSRRDDLTDGVVGDGLMHQPLSNLRQFHKVPDQAFPEIFDLTQVQIDDAHPF